MAGPDAPCVVGIKEWGRVGSRNGPVPTAPRLSDGDVRSTAPGATRMMSSLGPDSARGDWSERWPAGGPDSARGDWSERWAAGGPDSVEPVGGKGDWSESGHRQVIETRTFEDY